MFRDNHETDTRLKTDTHLQQKGPRSRLCPRRRCSSGVGKLPPTQTQGTLQNRHVKSQARESHWKKIQICCAKNTNKETQHAFFTLTWMSFVSPGTIMDYRLHNFSTSSAQINKVSYQYAFIVCCSVDHCQSLVLRTFVFSPLVDWVKL